MHCRSLRAVVVARYGHYTNSSSSSSTCFRPTSQWTAFLLLPSRVRPDQLEIPAGLTVRPTLTDTRLGLALALAAVGRQEVSAYRA